MDGLFYLLQGLTISNQDSVLVYLYSNRWRSME